MSKQKITTPKYTPGPWAYDAFQVVGQCMADSFNPERKAPYRIGSATIRPRGTFATICNLTWNDYDLAETAANAALISLAPELLEYVRGAAAEGCETARELIKRFRVQ